MSSGGHRRLTAFILWPFSPSKKSPLDPPSPWGWLGAYLAKRGFFSAPSSTPEEPEQTEDDEENEILKYLDMGDYSKDEQEIDDYFKKYL